MPSEKKKRLKKNTDGSLTLCKVEKTQKYIPYNTSNNTYQVQISCYLMGGKSKKGASAIFGTFLFFKNL